ncbi:MAG: peptidylprolyl isomerase [Phycisphaerae bacterium]|nr:peptidylprolyl isomerase [Phycisphaerae bacterium]
MRSSSILIALARSSLLALAVGSMPCGAALAQAPPTPQPPAAPDSLRGQYDTLKRFIARKGSISVDDRAAIIALLAKVKVEAERGSTDPVVLAMQAQLAGWIDDVQAQRSAYLRLLELQPSNEVAASQWIEAMAHRAQYEDAIEFANQRFPDLTVAPRVAVAVAEVLVAANRFDDAIKLLDQCSVATAARPELAMKVKNVRQRAESLAPLWAGEKAIRATEDGKTENARVQLVTTKGTVLLELFEREAPATTQSFVELVDSHFYDGTQFHRRIPSFAVLGGDANTKVGPTAQRGARPGFGTIGWRIPDENKRSDRRQAFGGTIGLCKALDGTPTGAFVPKSAGSQFFFLLQPAEFLHDDLAGFTIFGRIIDGWETVVALEAGDEVIAATVVRKGSHEYKSVREPELPMAMEMSVPSQPLRPPAGAAMNPATLPPSGAGGTPQRPKPPAPIPVTPQPR